VIFTEHLNLIYDRRKEGTTKNVGRNNTVCKSRLIIAIITCYSLCFIIGGRRPSVNRFLLYKLLKF